MALEVPLLVRGGLQPARVGDAVGAGIGDLLLDGEPADGLALRVRRVQVAVHAPPAVRRHLGVVTGVPRCMIGGDVIHELPEFDLGRPGGRHVDQRLAALGGVGDGLQQRGAPGARSQGGHLAVPPAPVRGGVALDPGDGVLHVLDRGVGLAGLPGLLLPGPPAQGQDLRSVALAVLGTGQGPVHREYQEAILSQGHRLGVQVLPASPDPSPAVDEHRGRGGGGGGQ